MSCWAIAGSRGPATAENTAAEGGLIFGYGCQRTADSRLFTETQAERIEPLAEPCCAQHELCFDPNPAANGLESIQCIHLVSPYNCNRHGPRPCVRDRLAR